MVNKEIIQKSLDDAISKCSDGTSFSKPLRKAMNGFQEEYGGLTDHEELSIFDNQGNLIQHEKGTEHSVEVDDDDLIDNNMKNLNVTHNHPTLFADKVPTYLSEGDMESLFQTNREGDDLYRSVTAVSPNDTSMTLIKTNKFSMKEADREKVWNAMMDLHDACESYYDFYEERVMDYMTMKAVEYQENHPGKFIRQSAFREEASNHTLQSMGTLRGYLKKHGVMDALGAVNLKVKLQT